MESPALSSRVNATTAPRFFFMFSLALIGIVLIGFAPTLFFRFMTNPLPIPWYLHLHGMLLTLWFVWLAAQAWFVRSANVDLHRRLGYFGAGYGIVVVCAGLMATFGVVPRVMSLGFSLESDIATLGIQGLGEGMTILAFLAGVVWTNLVMVVAFAVLLSAAVIFRRQSAWHKRFILLATIAFMGPALARISRWPGLGGEQGPFIPLVLLSLMIAVVGYDIVTQRKPHKATLIGIAVILVAIASGAAISGSPFGQEFVRSLA